MNNFLSFVAKEAPKVASALKGKTIGSDSFNNAWKSLASTMGSAFDAVQHAFIESSHYTPAVKSISSNLGFNAASRSKAVQDVLWSTAVQHGAGGALTIFRNAIGNNGNKMTDEQIIRAVYAERGANNGMKYFSGSSAPIRQSVVNRFGKELNDALRMLA